MPPPDSVVVRHTERLGFRILIAGTLLLQLSIIGEASPALGQSKATCAAYQAASAEFFATQAVRDHNLLQNVAIYIAPRTPRSEELEALFRAMKMLEESPAFKAAGEKAHRADRKAYQGPVVEDERAMADLVAADKRRCRKLKGNRESVLVIAEAYGHNFIAQTIR